jgi:hypothetical protein
MATHEEVQKTRETEIMNSKPYGYAIALNRMDERKSVPQLIPR